MQKIAVFTEGQTEQLFVLNLIRSLASTTKLRVELTRLGGGGRRESYVMKIAEFGPEHGYSIYFALIDCSNDERVATAVTEQYQGLIGSNFNRIIAVRDVFPKPSPDADRIREATLKSMPSDPIVPLLVLAVAEVEAWFMAEITHFEKIDASLTSERIFADTGIDVMANAEERAHPSTDLHTIYQLSGSVYDKSKPVVERVTSLLDYSRYLEDAGERAPAAVPLVTAVSEVFAQ